MGQIPMGMASPMARSSGTQIARGPKEQRPRARQTSRIQASPLRRRSPATRALVVEEVSSSFCLHSSCRVWWCALGIAPTSSLCKLFDILVAHCSLVTWLDLAAVIRALYVTVCRSESESCFDLGHLYSETT